MTTSRPASAARAISRVIASGEASPASRNRQRQWSEQSVCGLPPGYTFTPRELRGGVPLDADRLWDVSPLKYVERVMTPVLVIHSEEDHRCPIEQAEQWFTALKARGVETRFVRFPGENHELSRSGSPVHRVQRAEIILDWFAEKLT